MSQYGYTQLSYTFPVAKKKHKCSWCGEIIIPKETYERVVGNYYGELQTSKFHKECRLALEEDRRILDDYDYEFEPGRHKRGSTEEE